ncbi:uncharacterized protein [Rutidosis leptorrhynchoides]|uniref:uncharacterized protein n=1 Tax=Rutidosis leptorrhynchoides TaxID=125765 RepID=UPI003A992CB8
MEYAFSNHVERMALTRLSSSNCDFPLSLFSSESLKHLTLTGSQYGHLLICASTWELLALTTLYLDYVTFYDDDDTDRKGVGLFSKCINLQNLTLIHCEVKGLDGFYISHPTISKLALEYGDGKVVNVVAPKLVNLIIRDCGRKHLISAPELVYFHFKGFNPLDVSADGFPLLETMNLCIENLEKGDVHKIVSFYQQLITVKFLTVNLELVEFLSSQSKLISQQPSPFANLRSLKIYPENLDIDRKRSMSTKVKNYFLSHSPGAAFTMIPREEARCLSMARCLRDFIANSRVWLKREKLGIQRNMARIGQDKPQVENQMAQQGTQMQHHFWGLTAPIKSWWIDMKLEIDLGKSKIDDIVTRLEFIQGKIVQIPASKRDMVLAPFISLIAEANTVICEIMECMKIQFSADQSKLNVCFQDLIA